MRRSEPPLHSERKDAIRGNPERDRGAEENRPSNVKEVLVDRVVSQNLGSSGEGALPGTGTFGTLQSLPVPGVDCRKGTVERVVEVGGERHPHQMSGQVLGWKEVAAEEEGVGHDSRGHHGAQLRINRREVVVAQVKLTTRKRNTGDLLVQTTRLFLREYGRS